MSFRFTSGILMKTTDSTSGTFCIFGWTHLEHTKMSQSEPQRMTR